MKQEKKIPPIEKRVLDQQKTFLNSDKRLVEKRRGEWDDFDRKAKSIFIKVKSDEEINLIMGNLTIVDSALCHQQTKNQHFVELNSYPNSMNIQSIELNVDWSIKKIKNEFEQGGAITFSQFPNGKVACLVRGKKSNLITLQDPQFLYKIYSSPAEITTWEIWKALKVYFWYSRITSYSGNPTRFDMLKLLFFKIQSNTYKPDWQLIGTIVAVLVAVAGVLTTIRS